MRRLAIALLVAAATAQAACSERRPSAPPGRLALAPYPGRDVVVLSFDALRADALAPYGAPAATPAFSRLAAAAVTFDDALAAATATPTAFAAMFSGEWPHEVFRGWRLRARVTLAGHFRAAGYATALFANNPQLAAVRGFGDGFDRLEVDEADADGSTAERDRRMLARALGYLAEQRGSRRPSFVWIHLLDPHGPYVYHPTLAPRYPGPPSGRFAESSEPRFDDASPAELAWIRALYDGEVAVADGHLATLLDWLDEHAAASDTTLVVTADHGEAFREHGELQHATPYREVLRVPLFLRLPDGALAGTRATLPVSQVDLLATLSSLHGLPAPSPGDGIDWIRGGPSDRPRLATAMTSERGLAAAVSAGGLDLVVRCTGSVATGSLFDRSLDPEQRLDVAASRPDDYRRVAERLREELGDDPCAALLVAMNEAPAASPTVSPAAPEEAGLSPEQLARLRALGYAAAGPASGPVPELSFAPDPIPLCELGRFGVVTVRWRGAPGEVLIEVGAEQRLFAAGASAGEATTGPWANASTVFTLRDLETTRILVQRAPGAIPCPSPSGG